MLRDTLKTLLAAYGPSGNEHTVGQRVVFENGVEGVIYCQPLKGENPAMKYLFIDIGAEDRADAERSVQVGDMAVYAPDFFELGENRVASPAMDDRCACALLCEMLMYLDETPNTVVAVFSTQEEVGCRGAMTAAYSAGVPTGTLSIPCRYVHSPAEVIDMRDMEGALKLLLKLVEIA